MEKVLAIGHSFQSGHIISKLWSGAILSMSLACVALMMAGAMLTSSFYAAYLALRYTGIETRMATGMIGLIAMMIAWLVIRITSGYLRYLRETPAYTGSMIDAFFNGFL